MIDDGSWMMDDCGEVEDSLQISNRQSSIINAKGLP